MLGVVLLAACGGETAKSPVSTDPVPADSVASCPAFADGVRLGAVESDAIVEASGLAASQRTAGVLWMHNDSGDAPRIFAVGDDGRRLAAFRIVGAEARDWEDIAVGPGPVAGESCIYIGDIGDNAAQRSFVTVYRVPEPPVDNEADPVVTALTGVERLELIYPDGPSDAECLFVDPRNSDIFIVTKGSDGPARVYRAPAPHTGGSRVTVEPVATLAFGTGDLAGGRWVTAGDLSPDGDAILLRTYRRAFLWRRAGDEAVAAALLGEPCPVPLRAEPQGEAIGFAADGAGYFTVSEGEHPDLYFFGRVDAQPGP